MEEWLINMIKGEDGEGCMFKLLQHSEIECNCAKKFTEGLFRECSAL
jgi:hypothetical protein